MISRTVLLLAATLALAACGEKPQSAGGARQDTAAHAGTGMPYAEKNWKQGDRNSWEQQLKVRTQMGQNDYAKVN